jgi:hypothetical protein
MIAEGVLALVRCYSRPVGHGMAAVAGATPQQQPPRFHKPQDDDDGRSTRRGESEFVQVPIHAMREAGAHGLSPPGPNHLVPLCPGTHLAG